VKKLYGRHDNQDHGYFSAFLKIRRVDDYPILLEIIGPFHSNVCALLSASAAFMLKSVRRFGGSVTDAM